MVVGIVERTKQGLKITRFETKILDNQKKRLKGLDAQEISATQAKYKKNYYGIVLVSFLESLGMFSMS